MSEVQVEATFPDGTPGVGPGSPRPATGSPRKAATAARAGASTGSTTAASTAAPTSARLRKKSLDFWAGEAHTWVMTFPLFSSQDAAIDWATAHGATVSYDRTATWAHPLDERKNGLPVRITGYLRWKGEQVTWLVSPKYRDLDFTA